MDPKDCVHEDFQAHVSVGRILDIGKFVAEITISCMTCGVPMRFGGVPSGLDYEHPMVSITGEELRAPIEPAIETELHATASFNMPKIPTRN